MSKVDTSIIGKQYGRLTVIAYSHSSSEYSTGTSSFWLCRCSCGKEKIIRRVNLVNKHGCRSCGCLRRDNRLSFDQRGKPKSKRPDGEAGFQALLKNYKNRSTDFCISVAEFREFTKLPCHYCGQPPSQISRTTNKAVTEATRKRSEYTYSGLDRWDNTIGYTKENVRPCCKTCNKAKSSMTFDEFKQWALRLGAHIQNLDK